MPILSAKRQITLPKSLCDRLDVQPGDEVAILEHQGYITVIKKMAGASAGILSHVKADPRYTDSDSRDCVMEEPTTARRSRRGRAA